MITFLTVTGLVIACVVLMVLLVERFGSKSEQSQQEMKQKYGRWILPAVALLLILQLINALFFN